jgi:hypothetical protein
MLLSNQNKLEEDQHSLSLRINQCPEIEEQLNPSSTEEIETTKRRRKARVKTD